VITVPFVLIMLGIQFMDPASATLIFCLAIIAAVPGLVPARRG
jgi:hypothetical protein